MEHNNIQVQIKNQTAYLFLNRPEQHNALNPSLIMNLNSEFVKLNSNPSIQYIVLAGNGKSFCAGADINWFANAVNKSESENLIEYEDLAKLLLTIYQSPKITIAAAHKNVFGGANGLIAACDFAIATNNTIFSFSEVKLGIIPATILPFVAKRLSIQELRKLMLTGKLISSNDALVNGLIDYETEENELMTKVHELIDEISLGGPEAVKKCKALILDIADGKITESDTKTTAQILSKVVASEEGREGINAFLDKRKPNWLQSDNKNLN